MRASTSWPGPLERFYPDGKDGSPHSRHHDGKTEAAPRTSTLEVSVATDSPGTGDAKRPGIRAFRKPHPRVAAGAYRAETRWTEVSWRSGNPWNTPPGSSGVATAETGVRCRKKNPRSQEGSAKALLGSPLGSTTRNYQTCSPHLLSRARWLESHFLGSRRAVSAAPMPVRAPAAAAADDGRRSTGLWSAAAASTGRPC